MEDIIGHKIIRVSSKDLSEEDKKEILSIYKNNWKQENENTRNVLIQTLKESFNTSPDKIDSQFVMIKNHKEIVGFIRFEDKGGYEFASALNIKEEYKNFGLAEALLDASIKSRSIIRPVHARARLSLKYTQKYIEGFDAVGTNIENYHNTPHLNLIFSQKEKVKFLTSGLNLEEIRNLQNENLLIQKISNLEKLSLPEGFILTRIISDSEEGIYCILEKDSS